jgi:hypothetical protein
MTQKEKAQKLFDKYHLSFAGIVSFDDDWEALAKQCALIAVDLLITEMYAYDSSYYDNYYFEVKQEIEKL